MCVKMKSEELRRNIQHRCTRISIDSVMTGLRVTGYLTDPGDGTVELDDDFQQCLDELTQPIDTGDIVHVMNIGFYVVTDRHPRSANGSDLMRVLPVVFTSDGAFKPVGKERTILISPKSVIRVRKSKFDPETLERLTYQRFLAFQEVDRCNVALDALREQE